MKINKETMKKIVEAKVEKVSESFAKLVDVIINKTNETKEFVSTKVKGTVFEETRFDLHHLKTVCMVSLLAFFVTFYTTGFNTTRVSAMDMSTPEVSAYNAKPIEIQYGSSKKVASLAKKILGNQVSKVVAPKEIESSGLETVYEIGDYVATVKVNPTLGETEATLSIETKNTYAKNSAKTIVTPTDSENILVVDGMTYQYNVNLSIIDTQAPKIKLVMDDTTIMETDNYSAEDYISAVVDNVDGVMTNYKIINEVPKDKDGTLKHGRHYVTIRAEDSSGNVAEETLIVRVYKEVNDEKKTNSSSSSKPSNKYNKQYASNGSIGSTIASAALGQLGWKQDCTRLVTNALRAVGINFHGWPYEYLSLGTIVPYSQAMPGDIVVYNGHVAVYIGNGQCVHGGWYGVDTVIYSIYCNSGAFTIVRI